MIAKTSLQLILLNLVTTILIVSPFLPGPPNNVVHVIYGAAQVLALPALLLIPIGIVWIVKEFKRRKTDGRHHFDIKAVVMVTLSLNVFVSAFYLSQFARDFSRDFVMDRSENLVQSIEAFRSENGHYPDSLTELKPKYVARIPSTFIMGANGFVYERQDTTYNITFYQNVLMNFNFEVVTYDPSDRHKAEGELQEIYATDKVHWKYYVFD